MHPSQPESAGFTLEEMDAIFAKSNIWNVVKHSKETPRKFGRNGEMLDNGLDLEMTRSVDSEQTAAETGQNGEKKKKATV